MHEVLVDPFIQSFKRAPKKLILDFDAPDDAAHGNSTVGFFMDTMISTVFWRDQRLVRYLRPSKIDGVKHAWAVLSLLVKR